MAVFVALLRGINVGKHKRIPMPRLREVLEAAGFEDVATYVQSGNVVLRTSGKAADVKRDVATAIRDEWGFEVPVVVRTKAQLQKVFDADPIPGAADVPKHYQVTFLDAKVPASAFADIDPDGWGDSTYVATPTELYTFTPRGIHADRMLRALDRAHKDVHGTARNWTTVGALLEML
jgi:uncharacterized protein (DUF1697 family)